MVTLHPPDILCSPALPHTLYPLSLVSYTLPGIPYFTLCSPGTLITPFAIFPFSYPRFPGKSFRSQRIFEVKGWTKMGLGDKCATDFVVLVVNTDYSSPEVKGEVRKNNTKVV